MSRIFLNFEEKGKVFSEREEHKQLHSMFKNQQVGQFRWWITGIRGKKITAYKAEKVNWSKHRKLLEVAWGDN